MHMHFPSHLVFQCFPSFELGKLEECWVEHPQALVMDGPIYGELCTCRNPVWTIKNQPTQALLSMLPPKNQHHGSLRLELM